MALSPQQMQAAIIRNLPSKTGRSLEEWIAVAHQSGPTDRKLLHRWLKEEQGLGHFQAHIVANEACPTAN